MTTPTLNRLLDAVDAAAFLTNPTYPDDPAAARNQVLDELTDQLCTNDVVRSIVDTRAAVRRPADEAPPEPAPPTAAKKAAPKARSPRTPKASPVGDHACDDCDRTFSNGQGLASHRMAAHASGTFPCSEPDCDYVGTMQRALTRHRNQAHPAAAPESEPVQGPVPVPNFDGHHRLAHERRVGHDIDAYCACGASSGPTDREDARAWLHDHIENPAA